MNKFYNINIIIKNEIKNKLSKIKKGNYIMEKTKKIEKKDGFMFGVLALMLSQVLIKMLGLVSKIFLTNKKGFGDIGNGI